MEVEILNLCFGFDDTVEKIKLYKAGNRACVPSKEDLIRLKLTIEKWLDTNRKIHLSEYQNQIYNLLKKPE